MITIWVLAGVAFLFVMIGMILATLFAQRKCHKPNHSDTLASVSALNSTQPLWDAHTVFNVMNRIAITAERGGGIASSSIYNLSDHLLQGTLLQRDLGWANHFTLGAWLQAYLCILAESNEQSSQPNVRVDMAPGVHRFDSGPIIRQMIWRLQKAQIVEAVNVTFNVTDSSKNLAVAKLEIIGDLDAFGRNGRYSLTSVWRMGTRSSRCSVEVNYKSLI